jgi:hypothetical protein
LCLILSVFEGYGRGGRAIKDIAVGDTVLEIPQHLIICEDTVLNSSMVSCLEPFLNAQNNVGIFL